MKEFTQQEAILIASSANEKAREVIIHGSTQIENNLLPTDYINACIYGIHSLREKIREDKGFNPYHLEEKIYLDYTTSIKNIEKFNFGNCAELSMLAMSYIMESEPQIYVEDFVIDNGDHEFLVVNRTQFDSADPEKWNEEAIFCDPWANLVYPANMYKTYLKDYRRRDGLNEVVPLKPKQNLAAMAGYNSFDLQPNKIALSVNFMESLSKITATISNYHKQIYKRYEELEQKYGMLDSKAQILLLKKQELEQFLLALSEVHTDYALDKNTYAELKDHFIRTLCKIHQDAINCMEFSIVQQRTLFSDRDHSFKTRALRFFGVKPKTQTFLQKCTNETNNQFALISNTKK